MQEKRNRFLPSPKLVLIAATAGIIAGVVAVYMKGMGSGNAPDGIAAIDCSSADVKAATLVPFAKGEVAAFSVVKGSTPLALGAFVGPDAKPLTLDGLRGKTWLVNLWATWCVPCREEMPALDTLQKAFDRKKFEVIAINIDTGDDEKPKAFLSEIGIEALTFYRDATMGSFDALKKQGLAIGLPVTVLIDGEGCRLGSINGPADWGSEDAKNLIEAAL